MPNVLIVDDLAENRVLLQTILENYGHAVTSAANGAAALAAARAHPPELVISDILMPVMDGFTLCRQWRQDPGLRKIPFIFYTATYTDDKDEQLGLSLGADRFISKPSEYDVIVQAVEQLLRIGEGPAHSLPGDTPEPVYLKEYNEALIRKLEDKCTELKAANTRLRALDGMKNDLLANVSHELRTPLVTVRGFTEMIGAGQSGPVSPPQRDQCGVMLRNIDRLLVVIDNLLHLADGDRGGLPLDGTTFLAGRLLDEVGDQVRGKAQERNLTLTCDGGTVAVYGDRWQLFQALINIVDNAVKFTPPGGTVAISAVATPTEVQLLVRDNGPGIAADKQPHIFERFYQVDSSLTREHGGLGLGLSVAADLVSRHHGRITVASEPGQGALFTITLPRRP